MLGFPIGAWLGLYATGFAVGLAFALLPLPVPLRSLGAFLVAVASAGALVAMEFVRTCDRQRWQRWKVRAVRTLPTMARGDLWTMPPHATAAVVRGEVRSPA